MPKVTFNGATLADSDNTVVVENNYYFPPEDVNMTYFQPSARELTTVCPWKGTASYYDIHVDGEVLSDIAWVYPEAKPAAERIQGYMAFYKNRVKVED